MLALTLLTFLLDVPYGITQFRTCIPNTLFYWNERVCYCDNKGRWSEATCRTHRRQSCQPGRITWEGCTQCICQDNGQMSCTKTDCQASTKVLDFDVAGLWCTPFKIFYYNCSLCVCPLSGNITEAHCATDKSCSLKDLDSVQSVNKNVCIPKVMYLFPCLQCLCSDEGTFTINKCIKTCEKPKHFEISKRCNPKTFYRKDCNICYCAENSVHKDKYCTRSNCSNINLQPLKNLKNDTRICFPHRFTKPKCFYCDCNSKGTINESSCLELDCLGPNYSQYDINTYTCSPGEMVPICTQCYCLHNGETNSRYCSNACSHLSKLIVLEKLLKGGFGNYLLVDRNVTKQTSVNKMCDPDTIYVHRGRYCLCPDDGNRNTKLCTAGIEKLNTLKFDGYNSTNSMNFNVTCEPNTFVEFDCNSCYCNKNGKIDPKWCTHDDCDSIRVIKEFHKLSSEPEALETTAICTPGSISKVDCNFCICPDNGLFKDRACTKNNCDKLTRPLKNESFVCEPLAYYIVGCNICFCPRHGLKNVAKCTKNQCEKNFLRSDSCVPGELFSDSCNICVCPPNGNKADRVCTNHTCSDADTPWRKIFKISQNLLGKQLDNTTRSLDLCFPGEEFVVGCKVCVCPEMGLREYATCVPMLCDELTSNSLQSDTEPGREVDVDVRTRREENCITYSFTDSMERKECTPGSMYIIRCKQCICPYMGNINNFCRPLPPGAYCEQAYPYFNFLPMGRRQGNTTVNQTSRISRVKSKPMHKQIVINHIHTEYKCDKPGRIMDECFVCTCENTKVVVEEHCFMSDDIKCTDKKPSFLNTHNKVVLG